MRKTFASTQSGLTASVTADAHVDAERITEAFPDRIEAMGVLLEELPERLDRYHYDLVATTTFHADEAQAYVAGRVPVVAMIVGPGYMELVHEVTALPPGSKVGLVCGSQRGVENIAEVLLLSGAKGVKIVSAVANTEAMENSTWGVLGLTLRDTGYDWSFFSVLGGPAYFTDHGSQACH